MKVIGIYCVAKLYWQQLGIIMSLENEEFSKVIDCQKKFLKTKIFKLKYISSEDSNDSCELWTNFESLIWGLFGDLSVRRKCTNSF